MFNQSLSQQFNYIRTTYASMQLQRIEATFDSGNNLYLKRRFAFYNFFKWAEFFADVFFVLSLIFNLAAHFGFEVSNFFSTISLFTSVLVPLIVRFVTKNITQYMIFIPSTGQIIDAVFFAEQLVRSSYVTNIDDIVTVATCSDYGSFTPWRIMRSHIARYYYRLPFLQIFFSSTCSQTDNLYSSLIFALSHNRVLVISYFDMGDEDYYKNVARAELLSQLLNKNLHTPPPGKLLLDEIYYEDKKIPGIKSFANEAPPKTIKQDPVSPGPSDYKKPPKIINGPEDVINWTLFIIFCVWLLIWSLDELG